MKVSKHHYALELAERNCRVFFIEPPDLSYKGITVTPCNDHPLISIVKYRPVFRGKRFLPDTIYRFLLKRQVRLLIGKISHKPDVIWCFHGYLFENLKWFGAAVNIYFAADQFSHEAIPPEIRSAEITLAVSDTIYERIRLAGGKVFRINHGLQPLFVRNAKLIFEQGQKKLSGKKIVAGYTGNLRMGALDRQTMMKVIQENSDVHFIFWGSFKPNELNADGEQEKDINQFIQFLSNQSNVDMRGIVNSEELQIQMKEADLFWICWKIDEKGIWDGSNSHKILEYLSTGKPVVSHFVSSYKDDSVLYMLRDKSNVMYPDLFQKTITLVKEGESADIVGHRLETAIQNSYSNNLSKIAELISNG